MKNLSQEVKEKIARFEVTNIELIGKTLYITNEKPMSFSWAKFICEEVKSGAESVNFKEY